jgi:hypothetical protein
MPDQNEGTLSADAAELLLCAVADHRCAADFIDSNQGSLISANRRQFVDSGDARSEARWTAALTELVRNGLMKVDGVLRPVTDKGFALADRLKGSSEAHRMPVFTTSHEVEIVRAPGSPDEKRWTAMMGGDRATKALFYVEDRVRTRDEIHCEDIFDEPRIITKVRPEIVLDGSTSHWVAEMIPKSQWERANRAGQPTYSVTGQGGRINIGSVDQSVQQFHNHSPELAAVLKELDAIRDAVEHLTSSNDRRDAVIDVEQIRLELQRSKPEKSRIWDALGRLNTISGLAEKTAKLMPALDSFLSGF